MAARARSVTLGGFGFALAFTIADATRAAAQEPTEPAAAPAAPSSAAPPRDENAELAERLFAEGRDLAARGDSVSACLRFAASRKLEPRAVGPTLNLALCKENLAEYATAAELFRDVVARSAGSRPDRVELAEAHLRAIEPRIPTLRIVVDGRIQGARLELDGAPLAPGAFATETPIDGGSHTLIVQVPGQALSRFVFDVERVRGRAAIQVTAPDPPRTSPFPLVLGAVGALALAGGVGLGVSLAVRCGGLAQDTCSAANGLPDDRRSAKLEDLKTQGVISTVAIGVGVIATTAAAVILVGNKKERNVGVRLAAQGVGVAAFGTF